MPVVPMRPASSTTAAPNPLDALDPVYIAMAAGQLHLEGRLFETNDEMDRKPTGGGRKADEMTPGQLKSQTLPHPPNTIYDDSGKIVDIDTTPRGKRK